MRIAFIGLMKAGKDTVADYLCSKIPNCKVLKFADPLYELQGLIYDHLDWQLPPDGKDRTLLQLLGTEWGRSSIKYDVWVDVFQKRMEAEAESNVFVTDLRFPNELKRLKQLGFQIIYVRADEEIRLSRGAKSLKHSSEAMAQEWENQWLVNGGLDYLVLENSGTFEELYNKLDDLVAVYLEANSV